MMSLGTPSGDNTISFAENKTIVDSDLANNESLVVGDVIKEGSEASITYHADNSQLDANAEIIVVIEATEYKISGAVTFEVSKENLALSVVSAENLTISDAEDTKLTISNEDLVKAMASFSEMIADIVNGSATEESTIPTWVKGNYIGVAYSNAELTQPLGTLSLEVTSDQFTINVYLGASDPGNPGVTPLEVSASETDIVVNPDDSTDTQWVATLNNVQMNGEPTQLPIPVTVTLSETASGEKQLTVQATVTPLNITAVLTEKANA